MGVPKTAFDVQRDARGVSCRMLGYRAVQVLGYVRTEVQSHGIAPSYEMICEELGISSRAKVHKVVASLERRGLLSRVGAGRVRRIRLNGGTVLSI